MVPEFDAATELAEIVRVLDGINRYRFGKDPEAMAGWLAAKHVPGRSRGVRARGRALSEIRETPKQRS